MHYLVQTPGNFYPFDVYASNLKEAKEKVREILGVRRLGKGIAVWAYPPSSQRVVENSREMMRRDYARAGQIFDP